MFKIKKLLSSCIATMLLVSVLSVGLQAVQGSSIEIPKIVNKNVSLELKPDGTYQITANAQGAGPIQKSPISRGEMLMEISSPSPGELKADIDFPSLTLSELGLEQIPEEWKIWLSLLGLLGKSRAAKAINRYILDRLNLEGRKPYEIILMPYFIFQNLGKDDLAVQYLYLIANLPESFLNWIRKTETEVIELKFMEFSWREPTLSAGLTATFSNETFSNENLRNILPMTVSFSFGSGLDSAGGGEAWEVSTRIESGSEMPGFQDESFWTIKLPQEAQRFLEQQGVSEMVGDENVTFELKVPEGAEVRGLPENYHKPDIRTYRWFGDNAANAITSVVSGEACTQVNYAGVKRSTGKDEFTLFWIGVVVVVIIAIISGVAGARHWRGKSMF